jgi:hypothetical protein
MDIGMGRSLLTKEQLAALGAITLESAQLEQTIDFVIRACMEDFEVLIEDLTKNRMLGQKIDLLKMCGQGKLRGKRRKKILKEFTGLMDHCKLLVSRRAIVVHGSWQPEGGMKMNDMIQIMMGKWKPRAAEAKHKKGLMKAEKLEALAEDIAKIDSELKLFGIKYGVAPTMRWLNRADAAHQRTKKIDSNSATRSRW